MHLTSDAASLPLVSAVITTYRRPELLDRSLRSLAEERYPAIEILVVEDGSLLDEEILADLHRPVRLIQHNGPPRGVAFTRNLGLDDARGRYIICLDDDDVVEPDRIATLVAEAESHQLDICYGTTRKHLSPGSDRYYLIPTYPTESGEIAFPDMLTCMPHVNATLVRADALRAVGGYDSTTPHFDEWSPLLKILDGGGRGYFTESVVADWLMHDRGLTGDVRRERSLQSWIENLLVQVSGTLGSIGSSLVLQVLAHLRRSSISTYDEYVELARECLVPKQPKI